MNAIRTFAEVKDHEVRVTLPDSITSTKVEVIIIPMEQEDETALATQKISEMQDALLAAPDLNDADYELILEKRKALNQWN